MKLFMFINLKSVLILRGSDIYWNNFIEDITHDSYMLYQQVKG